ncbi:MATE family efflux transporter [Clostridioides mangenotii]|uniref:MATE family efflux transporter n=1 Tax=Metaclostridioides mangenotii TaxID=1540 RepID=UPI002149A9C3|nr:MATE family efflux transporter [Clostridioides mangenotii]MCR1955869.1 MATE family efflux transporter [Clostridioides mangenotii]
MNTYYLLKNFFKYVSLNVIGMIGLSCYILADTFFVSNALGSNGLAALNFSIPIYCIINGAGLMIGIGGATKYSILKSQNEDKKANSIFSNTVIIGMATGVVMLIVGIFLSTSIAKLLGAEGTTLTMASTYLTIILCFSPFFILNNIMIAFIRNDGDPRLSMAAMLTGSFTNIVLDYIFIFPLSMGMFGAAFATGLAPIISLCILSLHFIKQKNNFKLIKCKVNIKNIKNILGLGLSSLITEISSGLVLILFNLVILGITGIIGVAAYGIVANVALVVISIFTGIAQGIQPLLSEGYGKKDSILIKQVLKYAITLSLVLATVIYILTFLLSDNIIAAFNSENNAELISIAKNGLKLYFTGFFFAGFNIIIAAFLSATAKMKGAFVVSVMRGCIAIIPCLLILTAFLGMKGVWLSFTFAEIITTITAIMFLTKLRLKEENNGEIMNY